MKEKIYARLVEKYPNVAKKTLESLAERLSATATEESQIEDTINALENSPIKVSDLVAEGDRRVNEIKNPGSSQKPKGAKTDTKPGEQTPNKTEPEPEKQEPENEVLKLLRTLTEEVSQLKGEKVKTTIQTKAKEQLKDVPEAFWKGWAIPDKEEDLETFVTGVKAGFDEFRQTETGKGFAAFPAPAGGTGGKNDKAPEKEIKAIVSQL